MPSVVTALLAAACAGPLAPPDEARGPVEPEVVFQEGDVVLGAIAYTPCHRPGESGWRYGRLPPGDRVLLDLYFPRQEPPHHLFPRLWEEDVQSVAEVGAEIVHRFHMGVVRALVPRGSLERLRPRVARVVPREDRFDVRVMVGYRVGHEDAVAAAFERVGGVITDRYPSVGSFRGVVPDGRAPELRADDSVAYLIHTGLPVCLLAGAR